MSTVKLKPNFNHRTEISARAECLPVFDLSKMLFSIVFLEIISRIWFDCNIWGDDFSCCIDAVIESDLWRVNFSFASGAFLLLTDHTFNFSFMADKKYFNEFPYSKDSVSYFWILNFFTKHRFFEYVRYLRSINSVTSK